MTTIPISLMPVITLDINEMGQLTRKLPKLEREERLRILEAADVATPRSHGGHHQAQDNHRDSQDAAEGPETPI